MAFLDSTNFLNSVYALDIQLEKHLAGLAFNDDTLLDRVVYSSPEYMLRERSRANKETNNLDLPFLAYKFTGMSESSRNNFNNLLNTEGIWIEELSNKIRLTPIKLNYQVAILYGTNIDALQGLTNIHADWSNETILYPEITITDTDSNVATLPISAFLDYNGQALYDQGFASTENDWLRQNRYHSITLPNLSFETMLLVTDRDNTVSITEEAILEFLSSKPGYSGELYDKDTLDPQTLIESYFT